MLYKNYLNYSGSKDRIYPVIRTYLEKAVKGKKSKKKYLIDMFTGSGTIIFNSLDLFDYLIGIDKCKELIAIHNYIMGYSLDDILRVIDGIIEKYNLSKDNKDGFIKLREDYNYNVSINNFHPVTLYCLITHAYNYQLHTNKKGEFNAPSGAGRSYFNKSLRQKLINVKEHFKKSIFDDSGKLIKSVMFNTGDAMEAVYKLNKDSFEDTVFYVDPPYSASISKHPYRVGNIKWTDEEDRKLFECLDYIHENNGKFIFSNVVRNNGIENIPLQRWAGKYKINPIEVDYANCSYQRKNGGKTEEVIITNF